MVKYAITGLFWHTSNKIQIIALLSTFCHFKHELLRIEMSHSKTVPNIMTLHSRSLTFNNIVNPTDIDNIIERVRSAYIPPRTDH